MLYTSGTLPGYYSDTVVVVAPVPRTGATGSQIIKSYNVTTDPVSIDVVFNDSPHSPGYTITLLNLNQQIITGQYIAYWNLKRKSPNVGIWPDEIVRGADFIRQGSGGASAAIIEDLEAPFLPGQDDWEYILEVYTDAQTRASDYDLSATIGQLEDFVDTSPGQVYLKVIDNIPMSRYVFIEEFKSWKRPGRVLSESDVLGRKNKVLLTDVAKGKEGNFKIVVMNDDGDVSIRSNIFDIEATLETGDTILIQSTNYLSSGFKDTYCKIRGFDITRSTSFDPDDVDPETKFSVTVDFTEVDRPGTSVSTSFLTWQQVLDSNANWTEVTLDHDDWQDVLLSPGL